MTLLEIALVFVVLGGTVSAGVVLGLLTFGVAAVRGLATRTADVTPEDYRDRRVKARQLGKDEFPPDLAWPTYFRGQVGADLGRVRSGSMALSRGMFGRWSDVFLRGRYGDVRRWWFILLLPVLWLLVLAVSLLVVLVLGAFFTVVVVLCAAVALVLVHLAVGLQRTAEASWIRLRGAEASCPRCYYVSPRPAYRCPGCSLLHRDVRPGRLGVFSRRCQCGTRMPTMVLRAAWKLTAVCQRCEEPLRQGSAAVRDVRVPIFGDVSAGKTRFLYAALDSLVVDGERGGPAVAFTDAQSREQGERALAIIRSGQDTMKTSEQLPRALSCRLEAGRPVPAAPVRRRRRALPRRRGSEELGFLRTGHGLIYVIDPFAVGPVRDRLSGHSGAAADLARGSSGDPESAYGEVVSRLAAAASNPSPSVWRCRVRADLLEQYGVDLPSESDAVSEWLYDAGLHNLVLAATQEFAEVRTSRWPRCPRTGPAPDAPGRPALAAADAWSEVSRRGSAADGRGVRGEPAHHVSRGQVPARRRGRRAVRRGGPGAERARPVPIARRRHRRRRRLVLLQHGSAPRMTSTHARDRSRYDHSVVATVDDHGEVVVLCNAAGQETTPVRALPGAPPSCGGRRGQASRGRRSGQRRRADQAADGNRLPAMLRAQDHTPESVGPDPPPAHRGHRCLG